MSCQYGLYRASERDTIIVEVNMAPARQYVLEGGLDYAKDLLHKALGSQGQGCHRHVASDQQREKPLPLPVRRIHSSCQTS